MTHGNTAMKPRPTYADGHTPGERLAYPSVGAVFALFKGPGYKGMIRPTWC